MNDSILFKNVQLALPDGVREGDLFVEGGKIVDIGPSLSYSAELEINDRGLTLMPGVIDTHVHFREPGATHKEDLASGSQAAASGGVTSFFDMPNNSPACVTAADIIQKKQRAAETSLINYNFYIGATSDNLHELNTVENVAGIKIFIGSSTGDLLVDDESILDEIFRNGSRLIAVHAENEAMVQENAARYAGSTDVLDHTNVRSPEAALLGTKLAVKLAQKHQRRLHILHLTTAEEAVFLNKIGVGGAPPSPGTGLVTTEVCVQHLLHTAPDVYAQLGNFAKINPPIRDKAHRDQLWTSLLDGTIGMVVTDHAPHLPEEKQGPWQEAPSGMPGVETSLRLMLTQVAERRCRLEQVVQWMCAGPATTFGIQNKGTLIKGYDADLVLVDLNAKREILNATTVSKCGWSAFDGITTTGLPIATIVNGNMVYREGDFITDVMGQEIQLCE